MRPYAVLVLTWFTAGMCAVLGSILGGASGRGGLLAGAIAGGIFGVLLGVRVASRFRWLAASESRGAIAGGIVGFLVAVPIAVTHLDTPITPIVSCGLAGVGALIGAGMSRSAKGT
jgi:hypothetical protein